MNNLENFYIGQQITDNSGNYRGECVSYVKRYAQEILGVPNADTILYVKNDKAKNMFLDPNPPSLQYFDLISSNPERGDIAVYGMGTYGDVQVCLGGGKVIGQYGTPIFQKVSIKNIGSPIGYLRFKGEDMKIEDSDVWFSRMTQIVQLIQDRTLDRGEFASFIGRNPFDVTTDLADNQRARDVYDSRKVTEGTLGSLARAYLDDSLANNPGLKSYVGFTYPEVTATFDFSEQRKAYLKNLGAKDSVIVDLQKQLEKANVAIPAKLQAQLDKIDANTTDTKNIAQRILDAILSKFSFSKKK